MTVSLAFCRRSLLTSAVLLVAVALVVAAAVIPQVRADASPGAAPERAVHAFWANIVFNVLAAIVFWFVAVRTKGRSLLPLFVLGLLALVVLLFGYALTDAALAYRSHGPAMQTPSMILFFCSGIDFLAALLVITAASLFPKQA